MTIIGFFKKYKKYIIALLLIMVFILIGKFISTVDFQQLKIYLTQMPEMLVGVILASLCSYVAATWAWQLCMGEEVKKTRFLDLFMIKHVGEMLSAFNPTGIIAGEGIKAVYLNKRGINPQRGLSSIILSRVLVMLSGIFLMILAAIYLFLLKSDYEGKFLYIALLIVGVVLLSYLAGIFLLNPKLHLGRMAEKIQQKTHWSFLTDKTISSIYEINKTSSEYFASNKLRFTLAFLLSLSQWIFGALEFYLILKMMHIPITMVAAVAVEMGVMLFKSIGAMIPGQIGVEEYGNKVMLDIIDISSNEVWLTATLMRRARQLFWLAMAGIFLFFISKKTHIKIQK